MFDHMKLTERYSKGMYLLITFVFFVLVLHFHPMIAEFVARYVPEGIPDFGVKLAGYAASYILAFYILPEIGCWIYNQQAWQSRQ